jgi:hypothetical protein
MTGKFSHVSIFQPSIHLTETLVAVQSIGTITHWGVNVLLKRSVVSCAISIGNLIKQFNFA